jgi:formate dehydrogenase iron-sulfur subunit
LTRRQDRRCPCPDAKAQPGQVEFSKYGCNRLAEGKLPLCAQMCATKALLGSDADVVSDIYRERVVARGFGSGAWGWGWGTAYQMNGGA